MDYKEENPFVLKNRQHKIKVSKQKPKTLPEKSILPEQKFKEDNANRLLEDALVKAKDIINDAQNKANKIINSAENKKEDIKKSAFDKGYSEGYNKGHEKGFAIAQGEGMSKWEEKLTQFNTLRKELYDKNQAFREHLEKESVKLSILIAEKVLGDKTKNDEKEFLKLIKNALDTVATEKDVVIRVSESDYQKITKLNIKPKGVKSKISFIKDPTLELGDCIIEGNSFKIDAGVKSQINYIKSTLKEMDVIDDE